MNGCYGSTVYRVCALHVAKLVRFSMGKELKAVLNLDVFVLFVFFFFSMSSGTSSEKAIVGSSHVLLSNGAFGSQQPVHASFTIMIVWIFA